MSACRMSAVGRGTGRWDEGGNAGCSRGFFLRKVCFFSTRKVGNRIEE